MMTKSADSTGNRPISATQVITHKLFDYIFILQKEKLMDGILMSN